MFQTKQRQAGGYLLILVLVFGAVFFTIVSSFTAFIVTQSRLIAQKVELEGAGQIAEAGLNYYKWFLAHYPNDITNGTGAPGPYVGVYHDPEGAALGEYSLTIASTTYCGETASIDVRSTGHTYQNPDVDRTVSARYARPTVAEYSYILNSDSWVGSGTQITGPYHSNGGVHMDGRNNSLVTSGQSTWTCTPALGCTPTSTQPGVFTSTANSITSLFEFPSAPVNFAGITVDLAGIKSKAQNNGGRYFGPVSGPGYHIIFLPNGTYQVSTIRGNENEPNGYAWGQQMNLLKGTDILGTYTISAACPVIFVEDQVWLEGVVNGKVTIAVADVDTVGVDPSLILNNDITYGTATSGLLAIGELDVIVGLQVPDNTYLNGIFIAQSGSFRRNEYDTRMPNVWEEYMNRNSLTINGTVVSNGRVTTKWFDGVGVQRSGFNTLYSTYDRNLVANPPPLVPVTSDVYRFSDWRDEN